MTFFYQARAVAIPAASVATTTITFSGLNLGGGVPKAIIATLIGLDALGGANAADDALRLSRGMATSTSLRRNVAAFSDFSGATSDTARKRSTDALVTEISGTAQTGAIDVADMSTPNQVGLVIDDQLAVDSTLILEVFAGDEITGATIVDFNKTASTTGAFNVTTPGFPCAFVEVISALTTNTSAMATMDLSIGRATPVTAENQLLSIFALDNQASSDTARYANDVEAACVFSATNALAYRAAVSAQHATGFVWNEIENSDATLRNFSALCLGGTFQVKVGSFPFPIDPATVAVPTGFLTAGMSLIGHSTTESTTDTPQAAAHHTLGAVELSTGFFNHAAVCAQIPDASATQSSLYANATGTGALAACAISTDGTGFNSALQAQSKDATSVTFGSVGPANADLVLYAAFGAASSGMGMGVMGSAGKGFLGRAIARGWV